MGQWDRALLFIENNGSLPRFAKTRTFRDATPVPAVNYNVVYIRLYYTRYYVLICVHT